MKVVAKSHRLEDSQKYGRRSLCFVTSFWWHSRKTLHRIVLLTVSALGVVLLSWYILSVSAPHSYVDQSSTRMTVLYHPARLDRSGSVIHDMLLAHAYAYRNNLTYGGACFTNSTPASLPLHRTLIEAIGLSQVLRFTCPSNEVSSNASILWVDSPVYTRFGTRIWAPEWLEYIRSLQSLPPPIRTSTPRAQLVVHIRRGDVSLCDPGTIDRYLPNAYYQQLFQEEQRLSNEVAEVSVYSERNSTEGWEDDDFRSLIHNLHLDASPAEAWKAMMTADVLILSWSSFSIVPAIFNRHGRIVYTPFWVQPLPHWQVVDDDAVRSMQRAKLRLKHKLC
jgi:hypothetical protein